MLNKTQHIKRLLDSYEYFTGKRIIERSTANNDRKAVEEGQFVLVSHNGAEDPILNYGNPFALKLWEMEWEDFTSTPSRLTAEIDRREKREEMLQIAKEKGWFDGYEGVRISKSGKRFRISNAVIWNVLDGEGKKIGQAAWFEEVVFLSEKIRLRFHQSLRYALQRQLSVTFPSG